jgi:putative membrane protein
VAALQVATNAVATKSVSLSIKVEFMKDGFLGFRTSFMLDFVVVALVLIVPVLVFSLYLVKIQKQYTAHRNLQLLLGIVLLVAVGLFEVDLQWVQKGWENVVAKRATPLTAEQLGFVRILLRVHLVFAITTPLLWVATIVLALRRMPSPPQPCAHSQLHKKLGWASTIDIVLTSITGLVFYYFAFVTKY